MGIEQRKYPRHAVHLAVKYATAAQFVSDYVENLSTGGLFITGAHHLEMHQHVDVSLELPGHGQWAIVGKAVFLLGPEAAKQLGRKPGAGLEIVRKPAAFDDALLGYLLRLGRRRDHAVIAAEIPGVEAITNAGYRVLPLVKPTEVASALADPTARVIAVVVPPSLVQSYKPFARERLFAVVTPEDVADALALIDSML